MTKQSVIDFILLGWSDSAICMYSQHTNKTWSTSSITSLRKECKLVVDLPN